MPEYRMVMRKGDDGGMPHAHLSLDREFSVAPVPRRMFGSFVEHMGRCVYTGIYEPGHPAADEQGFRRDVLELVRELGAHGRPLPRRQLRLRLQLGGRRRPGRASGPTGSTCAWRSVETNRSGCDEFIGLGRRGRRRADDGGQPRHPRGRRRPATCVEYANHPGGT